jgi:hypothetical protein
MNRLSNDISEQACPGDWETPADDLRPARDLSRRRTQAPAPGISPEMVRRVVVLPAPLELIGDDLASRLTPRRAIRMRP